MQLEDRNQNILPKKGIDAVSPFATIEGPPKYTIATLSIKEECGASATNGASARVVGRPITFKRTPPIVYMKKINLAIRDFRDLWRERVK